MGAMATISHEEIQEKEPSFEKRPTKIWESR
jgi:hypothetical protein